MEVLEHAPASTRRAWPRWVWIAIAGVFAALLIAWWLDGVQRDRETEALQQAYTTGVSAIERGESAVRGTVAYASPQLQVGPPAVRSALEELVLEEVEAGVTEVDAARQALTEQTVWPWHSDQAALRDQLLAELDARSTALRQATGQGLAPRS